MKMTAHVITERMDRMVAIATHIGWGEIIVEVSDSIRRTCLTSTGVIFIKDLHEEVLVTAYPATFKQAHGIYYQAYGDGRMPDYLVSRIKKNNQNRKRYGW